jgi:CheY-like chemotaxis protein
MRHGDSVHVFVAENQPEMRALIARALRQEGYEVIEASDESTALVESLVRSMLDDARAPEVILMDIQTLGASGLDVAAQLGRSEGGTPIIVITAVCDAQPLAEA